VCNADCSLREAIAAAVSGDVIEFAKPLFDTAQTIDLTLGELLINKSLTITGTGANLLTVRRATGGDYRIFNIPTRGRIIAITGLTIRDGKAVGDDNAGFGGGIASFSSNLTLTDCAILDNESKEGGGGVFLAFANGTFSGCTFSGNTSDFGGAIRFDFGVGEVGMLRLNNCTLSGNSASKGAGGVLNFSYVGGAGTLEVTNCNIVNNIAPSGWGGAVYWGTVYLVGIQLRAYGTRLSLITRCRTLESQLLQAKQPLVHWEAI
jgi:hypothetical protein